MAEAVKELSEVLRQNSAVATLRYNHGNNYAVIYRTPVAHTSVLQCVITTKDEYAKIDRLPNINSNRVLDLDPTIEEVDVFTATLGPIDTTKSQAGFQTEEELIATFNVVQLSDAPNKKNKIHLSEEELLKIMYGKPGGSGLAWFRGGGTLQDEIAVMNVENEKIAEDRQFKRAQLIFVDPTASGDDVTSRAGTYELFGSLIEAVQSHYNGKEDLKDLWRTVALIEQTNNNPLLERLISAHLIAEKLLMDRGVIPDDIAPKYKYLHSRLSNLKAILVEICNAFDPTQKQRFQNDEVRAVIESLQDRLLIEDFVAGRSEALVASETVDNEVPDFKTAQFKKLFLKMLELLHAAEGVFSQDKGETVERAKRSIYERIFKTIQEQVQIQLADNYHLKSEDVPSIEDFITYFKWLTDKDNTNTWWVDLGDVYIYDKHSNPGRDFIKGNYSRVNESNRADYRDLIYSREIMREEILNYVSKRISDHQIGELASQVKPD